MIKENDTGTTCRTDGNNAYRVFEGRTEGKTPLERPRHRWEDNTRIDLREIRWYRVVWTRFIWLKIGNNGGLLWMRQWTFGFYRILRNSSTSAQLVASLEELGSTYLVPIIWVMSDTQNLSQTGSVPVIRWKIVLLSSDLREVGFDHCT
jgi:hypothetical protein